mmetsp:Transcript_24442/g.55778  ORF Transcript_24442/g.55778 Transcript_24442/m.55778 type:complete len:92 (-) Transcript_24442:1442-1717(-)
MRYSSLPSLISRPKEALFHSIYQEKVMLYCPKKSLPDIDFIQHLHSPLYPHHHLLNTCVFSASEYSDSATVAKKSETGAPRQTSQSFYSLQ